MFEKSFKINKRAFNKRKLTTIQHKLRVVMKCYTIVDFELDDESRVFKFKKSHKINGIRMNDPKNHQGRFEVEDLDENNILLKIIIGENSNDTNK